MNNDTETKVEKIETVEFMPLVDILEENDNLTMFFEVPGANSQTVKVEVKGKILSMTAESTLRKGGRKVVFKREFQLSDQIDASGIKAKTADGVLTLSLPKSDQAKVYKIAVE